VAQADDGISSNPRAGANCSPGRLLSSPDGKVGVVRALCRSDAFLKLRPEQPNESGTKLRCLHIFGLSVSLSAIAMSAENIQPALGHRQSKCGRERIPRIGPDTQKPVPAKQLHCSPMSSAQLRVWFVEQLAEGAAVNNLFFGVHLSGELNLSALDLSLRVVVARHEALRTIFDTYDGKPVQLIGRARTPTAALIDLSELAAPDLAKEAYALACQEVNKTFDLTRGPLVRLVLLRLGSQNHIMLAILHHIICDGWSLGLFANELATCYAAFCSGASPPLTPVRLQYSDYAAWQRKWLVSQDFERQLSYWIHTLDGTNILLDLSANSIRPIELSFAGVRQTRRLPEGLIPQLSVVAKRYDATPFALLLTVCQVVLCQYTGEMDVIVGMPVAGRNSVELENVIGLFTNLVVVRTDLSGDPAVAKLLREVRNAIVDALTNQDVPFERLVQAVHPSRSPAQNPIFQVLFASVKAASPWENFGALKASPYIVDPTAVAFDLTLSCIEESPDTLCLSADYRTDLFAYDQISCLLDHYVQVLRRVVERPEMLLSELERPSSWPVASGARKRPAASEAVVTSGISAALPAEIRAPLPTPVRRRRQWGDITEEVLADLWAKVLGTRPRAATSNFFDIGGHSLLAVYLASEISRVFGTNFPVSLVFQEPTIDAMARRLRTRVHTASSTVALQEGGSLKPFFCGGSMREFLDLSRALGPNQPFFQLDVFSLQQQRLYTGQPLFTSFPSLAARFLQDILTVQSSGPYFLGGMCEGGILALEIALQLQAQGREVALLAQFDTPVNGYWRKRPVDWIMHGASLIYTRRLVPRMRERGRARSHPRVAMTPEEETYAHIVKVTWQAIRAYRPARRFQGEIQIFLAPPPPPPTWFREGAVAGWQARASRGIRVHDVVGDHAKLFCDPISQRTIASVLERAQRGFVSM
jgi:thioesterase domain-containing protein